MNLLKALQFPIILLALSLSLINVLARNKQLVGDDQLHAGCTSEHFEIKVHKPYDVETKQRFTYNNDTGIFHFLVRKDDKPFKLHSSTEPRTEIRFLGLDYSTGIWMFEGQVLVPSNVSGACVTQIRPYRDHTLTMILARDDNLMHYNRETLAENIYGKWQHILVRHDVEEGSVEHYINGTLKLTTRIDPVVEKTAAPFYFKCGVYMTGDGASQVIESSWKELKIWNCTDVNGKAGSKGGQNSQEEGSGRVNEAENGEETEEEEEEDGTVQNKKNAGGKQT